MKKDRQSIGGIIVPMLTPLNVDGRIDEDSVIKMINFLIKGGIDGLFLMGSLGEGPLLPRKEKLKLLEIAVSVLDKKLPLYLGVSAPSTGLVVEEIKLFERFSPTAFVCCPPFYFPVSQTAIIEFYQTLANRSSLPVLIYNIPPFAHSEIEPETIHELAATEGIAGIKDSSINLVKVQKLICEFRKNPEFSVLIGEEAGYLPALVQGASGIVSVAGNLFPGLLKRLVKAAAKNDLKEAVKLQTQLLKVKNLYACGSNIVSAVKAAAHLMGLSELYTCTPTSPANKDEYGKIKKCFLSLKKEIGQN